MNEDLQNVRRYMPLAEEETSPEEAMKKGAACFGKLAKACIIFAVMFAFGLYRNFYGAAVVLWIVSLIWLITWFCREKNGGLRKGSTSIFAALGLLGCSHFLTDNAHIITMNLAAEFLLTVTVLLHNFADDSKWDFGKYFAEIFKSVFWSVGGIVFPFRDGKYFFKTREDEKDKKRSSVLLGVLIAIPCLIVLGVLLASADMVFSKLFRDIFVKWFSIETIICSTIMIIFAFLASYCGLRLIEKRSGRITVKEHKNGQPVTAITITAMVAVLYLIFCVIQVVYLFMGGLELPAGITYAEYARKGFFQLLAVCLINLVTVLVFKKYIRENRVLNALLLVITACTYIMVASSAYRMILYIGAYGMTFLRLFVLVALLTIAVLLAGVIIKIIRPEFNFFKMGVAVISVIYICFAFSHADYFIAAYNVSDERNFEEVDMEYLSELSADAAPVIIDYCQKMDLNCADYLPWSVLHLEQPGIRTFNVSRYIAWEELTEKKVYLERLTAEWMAGVYGGEIVEDIDTHGGFNGDGSSMVTIDFGESGRSLSDDLAQSSFWHELPLSDRLNELAYVQLSNQLEIPEVEQGYWYFYDRHFMAENRYDDSKIDYGRVSYNLTFAIYDSIGNKMYIIDFDT